MTSLAKVPEKVIVVLDEAYTEFTHPSERVNSLHYWENTQTLLFLAPIKSYGLAGLRIGYTQFSNPEIADLLKLCSSTV